MLTTVTRVGGIAGSLLLLSGRVNAVPSVNVALQPSFNAPPYLVELLETAAEENATAYFPLLDRIADGYFDTASTDQDLYRRFRALLQEDGHLNHEEDLAIFDLALSIHSAAPRVEAQFQFYNTSVVPSVRDSDKETACESWVHVPFSGQRYCSPEIQESAAIAYGKAGDAVRQLPFDRVLGDPTSERPSVLYADITSPSFRTFHKALSKTAREGKTSYRVRYRESSNLARPLSVSGYGVELALKRTDYIVIDDRQAQEQEQNDNKKGAASGSATLNEDEDVADLRPLATSELRGLGMKAASFVLKSDTPFETLLRLSQDFPKHSSYIASTEVSPEFVAEYHANFQNMIPNGYNIMWINGVQMMSRDVNVYSLLEFLRRERSLITNTKQAIGITAPQAIELLSHSAIAESQVGRENPRYDWRDEIEGGGVIIWMNDIENDKRYADWPTSVTALLQRVFPGQLPSVRRNIHNIVLPLDLDSVADVETIVEGLRSFVKRKVPIQFGIVPLTASEVAVEHAKVAYYLLDRFGIAVVLEYLERAVNGASKKLGRPTQKVFDAVVAEKHMRSEDLTSLTLSEALADEAMATKVNAARAYALRLMLGQDGVTKAPILVNGVSIPFTEDWLQYMSQQVGNDLSQLQRVVYESVLTDADHLPNFFLANANPKRNPLIIPEDEKSIRHLQLDIHGDELENAPSLVASPDTIERELVHLTLVADLNTFDGFEQAMEILFFHQSRDNVEIAVLPLATITVAPATLNTCLDAQSLRDRLSAHESESSRDSSDVAQRREFYRALFDDLTKEQVSTENQEITPAASAALILALNLQADAKAVIVNGRVVGPYSADTFLDVSDLEALLEYERKRRSLPAALAIKDLNLESQASTPFKFARISNLIALSLVSDVPEGIYEAASTVRADVFKRWNGTHSSISVGDENTAAISITASIDPASESAQRWIPILKVLSELEGVHLRLFLNPQDRLEEIPIKRFYRHVLQSKPLFDQTDGSLRELGAHFSGLPAEALLNIGMDLPPSWLVAPKETIHDLDNIKLSAVRSGANIDAVYELEHILIEGHSRDVTPAPPPRGVQLVLETDADPHFADTIIMANLGYFQFKANPGFYRLGLQKGRSKEIFHIDGAGLTMPGIAEDSTDIALMSFRGVTLFPRLSRNSGMENEDVLEPSSSTLGNLAGSADKLLTQAGGLFSGLSNLFSGKPNESTASSTALISRQKHADINIFSVASGHLYERMLNIMMLSVTKHTNHTVKFWFIEQFLSPSFKEFLPFMAATYHFQYEMVTYKWPHWLRAQKEKQREIWGYKILFLDVLFPLDLDKVIFVDADQIVRADMYELVTHDLQGKPYGFTPMCDSRTEMEGFRFWKQGYWANFLRGLPYHISALYVVDLKRFRQTAAGDRLRQNYQALSADPNSLSNLDQDLPNHMQQALPIHSLPQDWLWCETWCSDEALATAKTIDLCNNPQTKEPKLDRARRQVPEWTLYDDEIAELARSVKANKTEGSRLEGGPGVDGIGNGAGDESIQEQLQREDAERERRKRDEL